MTILDIAQSMKGRLRDGLSQTQSGTQPGESEVAFGTAAADSSGGFVSIIMDGAPQPGDPDYDPDDPDFYDKYTFTVPCDSPILENSRVSYISDAGRGKAVSLGTLTQIAEDADAIATATNQHFWADTNGVHVSTDQDDPAGAQNIIMNSAGVLLREGSDYLAAFTPSAVAFYDGNGNNADNITASFGSSGAVVGKTAEDESRAEVASDGMRIIVNAQGSDWAFAEIVTDRDEYDIPYFATTFGMRDTGTVGKDSFAVGANCVASGDLSFAAGQSAVASGNRQMAIGRYNVADATSAFIIGNGFNDNARSNALTVDWSGDITAGGEVIDGNGNKLSDPCDLTTATGTLPIASGGTGATTAQGARKNLHIGAATATKTSATSTATTNTKITLNSITSSDSSLFSISSGGIKCAVAGTVLVSASMYETSIASGNGGFALRILNGSTLIGSELVAPFTTSSLMATVTAAPRAVTVAAGDVIYLYHRSTKSGSIPANGAYLTVEYIA